MNNRKKLGYCPQDTVLWEDLTPLEHLKIFSMIKADDDEDIEENIEFVVDKLNMQSILYQRVRDLSGGQQRKTSLGIAFVGKPQLVILDEPSRSLDPLKRRKFWNLTKSRFHL